MVKKNESDGMVKRRASKRNIVIDGLDVEAERAKLGSLCVHLALAGSPLVDSAAALAKAFNEAYPKS